MAAIGSTTKPVYVGSNGDARPCSLELHDIGVDNKGDNKTIAIITIDGTPFEIKNFKQGGTAFTVKFVDWDGTVLKTEPVLKGGNATPPTNPTREGYNFQSWSGTYTNVQADQTVTATYKIKTFTVIFRKYQDSTYTQVGATQTIEWGKAATDPGLPSVTGYNTSAWDTAFTCIKADTTVTCTLTKKEYTITFKNNGGTVLDSQKWKYGETPSYSGTPTHEGGETGKTYKFSGWSPTIVAVTADATYTAQYTEESLKYTVTFVDGFGSTLKTVPNVVHGTLLSAVEHPSNPTYGPTAQYTFSFTGWDVAETTAITGDTTVTAQWKQTVRQYTVTFNDYDGTQLGQQTVDYGTLFTNVTKPSDPTRTGYTFTGWSTPSNLGATGQVIDNCVSTATYTEALYTITYKDNNGGADVPISGLPYGCKFCDTNSFGRKPSKSGYIFSHWTYVTPASKYGVGVGDTDLIQEDWVIEANYLTDTSETYTVTLSVDPTDGGYTEIDGFKRSSKSGKDYAYTIEAIPNPGFSFVSWSDGGAQKHTVFGNQTLTATFVESGPKTVTVKFYNHSGTNKELISEQTIDTGTSPTVPDDPTLSGWTFIGWNGTPDAGEPLYQDTEYTGEWKTSFNASGTLPAAKDGSYQVGYTCTIPAGCSIDAGYGGTLQHTAGATSHKAQFHLYAGGSTFSTSDTLIDGWDEIYTSQARDEFDVGDGYCGMTTIPSDCTKLWFDARKIASTKCPVKWIASLTVTATMY